MEQNETDLSILLNYEFSSGIDIPETYERKCV